MWCLMVRHDGPALDLIDHLLVQPLQNMNRPLELELDIARLYLLFQLTDSCDQ